jgi:hypothetical protein
MKMPSGVKMPKFDSEDGKRNRIYAAGAAAGLIVIALVLVLALGGGDSSSTSGTEPQVVSVDALREDVSGENPPVYWAGEQPGSEFELSRPGEGRTYVRYLTGGAKAGDERPDFLTVGTYLHANPVKALKEQAQEGGGVLGTAPGNATVYFKRKEPHSVYLAYPGVEVEIEVYDPDFTKALQLVNSGQIIPVG